MPICNKPDCWARQAKGTKTAETNKSQTSAQLAELMQKRNNYYSEVSTFIQASRKTRDTLLDKARQIYQTKYSADIESLEKRLGELSYDYTGGIGDGEVLKAQMKSLRDKLDRLLVAYRTEIAAPWLDQTQKEMAQIKSLIQSAKVAEAANEQMLKLMDEPVYPQQEAASWAMEYLSTALNVIEFEPGK